MSKNLNDLFESEDNTKESGGDPRMGLPPEVEVEIADTPMELTPPVPGDNQGPWVEYIGVGTLRIMDTAAWKDAKVDSTNYFEWNYLNHKRIPRSAFTDEELQYLLRRDGRFRLVES